MMSNCCYYYQSPALVHMKFPTFLFITALYLGDDRRCKKMTILQEWEGVEGMWILWINHQSKINTIRKSPPCMLILRQLSGQHSHVTQLLTRSCLRFWLTSSRLFKDQKRLGLYNQSNNISWCIAFPSNKVLCTRMHFLQILW